MGNKILPSIMNFESLSNDLLGSKEVKKRKKNNIQEKNLWRPELEREVWQKIQEASLYFCKSMPQTIIELSKKN